MGSWADALCLGFHLPPPQEYRKSSHEPSLSHPNRSARFAVPVYQAVPNRANINPIQHICRRHRTTNGHGLWSDGSIFYLHSLEKPLLIG